MRKDSPVGRHITSFYDVLQVSPTASQEVIHAAYRALARGNHPDVNPTAGGGQRMRQLNTAYDVLGDAERRARYDLRLIRSSRPGVVSASPPVSSMRGRPRPHAPKRVEDERAAGATSRPAWTSGRQRIVFLFAVMIVLALALSLVLWLTVEPMDDMPYAFYGEPPVFISSPLEVGARLDPWTPDRRTSAQPFLNRR